METVEVVEVAEPKDARELVMQMLEEAEAKERECAISICAGLKAIGMAAKDLHYRAKGEAFYSDHLLADLAAKSEGLTDDFIEVYYLGDKGWNPPTMAEVYNRASTRLLAMNPEEAKDAPSSYWANRLLKECERTIADVEDGKKFLTTKAGTQASLDEISKEVLVVAGLLKRVLK